MVTRGDAITRCSAFVQGGFYLGTGLWPLVHLPSFLAVTGPKEDLWLVQTVGALILVVGATLLVAALEGGRPSLALHVLGMGSAAAFIAVDLVFYAAGILRAVYLLDALAEAAVLVGWSTGAALNARRIRAGAT